MAPRPLPVVFVHGWSVTHTDTYGHLPERLAAEADAYGLAIDVRRIWLGEYVSFHDEVRLEDVSRALEAAVRRELGDLIAKGERFAAITHSTGGPVMRDWQWRFYHPGAGGGACPMSHLVMLAPANFGSALAQLGKGRLSRIKAWFQGVEPGQGILDWLELGSAGSQALNRAWIAGDFGPPGPRGVFPFVLTGQSIDRSLYDALNSYTGEMGSDGVVRVASANLNASAVRLVQRGSALEPEAPERAPRSALRLIAGASHSGSKMGILRSVSRAPGGRGAEVADAVLRALAVTTEKQYDALCDAFQAESDAVRAAERVEVEDRLLLRDRAFPHDPTTQVVFRVLDSDGNAVTDFDLLLTGKDDDPYQLPKGFFLDRQRNRLRPNTVTYFLNHAILAGCAELRDGDDVVRPASPGIDVLGLRVEPRPLEGFVHYAPAALRASRALHETVLRCDETVLVDIVLCRIVHEGVAHLELGVKPRSFKSVKPGKPIEPAG